MTPAIERLRALLEAATPGEWEAWCDTAQPAGMQWAVRGDSFIVADLFDNGGPGKREYGQANAELIAAMKSNMPALLAAAERYYHMRDNDMTVEYNEYITGNLNGRSVDPLDSTIDAALARKEG